MKEKMYELIQARLARSEEALQDGNNPALSPRSRLLLYFDAGYFCVLAGLEREDRETITYRYGWDFASALQSAGKILALSLADVRAGIELSETVYMALSEEPDEFDLTEARAWAVRVRGLVHAWLESLPPGAVADA